MASKAASLTRLLGFVAFNQVNARFCVRKFSTLSRLLPVSKTCLTNGTNRDDSTAAKFSGLREFSSSDSNGIKASLLTEEKLKKSEKSVGCTICRRDITFSYKDVLFLAQFMSPKGYILNRRVTGVCKKQQRKLEKAIKISQRLGLLPKLSPLLARPKST